MTPAVGGVVIMLVSVNLIPIAMNLWVGYPGTPQYCSRENFVVGALTLAVILVLGIFGSPRGSAPGRRLPGLFSDTSLRGSLEYLNCPIMIKPCFSVCPAAIGPVSN